MLFCITRICQKYDIFDIFNTTHAIFGKINSNKIELRKGEIYEYEKEKQYNGWIGSIRAIINLLSNYYDDNTEKKLMHIHVQNVME